MWALRNRVLAALWCSAGCSLSCGFRGLHLLTCPNSWMPPSIGVCFTVCAVHVCLDAPLSPVEAALLSTLRPSAWWPGLWAPDIPMGCGSQHRHLPVWLQTSCHSALGLSFPFAKWGKQLLTTRHVGGSDEQIQGERPKVPGMGCAPASVTCDHSPCKIDLEGWCMSRG